MLQIEMTNEQWMDGVIERKFNKDYPAQDVERIAKIRDQIAAMTQRAERAEAVVEKLEWSGQTLNGPSREGGRMVPCCPMCRGVKRGNGGFIEDAYGHRGGCSLKAAIDAKGGK